MELNTASLGDFVRLAPIIFNREADSLPQHARDSGMFQVEAIPMNSGNTREYTEIDLEEYADDKSESDQSARASVQQGYKKVLTSYRVSKDLGISFEMRTQNKYTSVIRRLTNLAGLAINRQDLDLTHRITFGTATTYTNRNGRSIDIALGDTLALFSTAHTLKASSSTYRNRLANNPSVSKGSLESMEQQVIENTVNHFNEKVTIDFDIIWSGDDPNTNNMITELIRSTATTDSGKNEGVINQYQNKYRHVRLPRLATDNLGNVNTSKNAYWGLASSKITDGVLAVWEEARLKSPSTTDAAEDFSSDDWNFGVRAGYGIVIVSGRWIHFSSGDGVA